MAQRAPGKPGQRGWRLGLARLAAELGSWRGVGKKQKTGELRHWILTTLRDRVKIQAARMDKTAELPGQIPMDLGGLLMIT